MFDEIVLKICTIFYSKKKTEALITTLFISKCANSKRRNEWWLEWTTNISLNRQRGKK